MHEPEEISLGVWPEEIERARADLLAEGIAQVRTRACRYVQEPAETAWHELVQALTRTYGDTETYDLLRAVEIHLRTYIRR